MAFSTARHRALSTLLSYSNYLTTPSSALCAFTSSSYRATRFALPLLDRIDRTLFDTSTRSYAVGRGGGGHSPLKDPSPNWTNRPPKETILLDGCDYEHWLIVMEFPEDPKLSQDEMIAAYVKTLAQVVGSEEEAKKKIYSVSTTTYTGFGALISEELSLKMKELPQVLWVLPDSYLDVPNKDYGGDLFVDGKVIRRPQYDFSNRQPTKTRPRPRYDRCRQSMQVERRPMNSSMGQAQHDQRPTSGEGQNSS